MIVCGCTLDCKCEEAERLWEDAWKLWRNRDIEGFKRGLELYREHCKRVNFSEAHRKYKEEYKC